MEQAGPFRLKPQALHSPFEALAEAIIYQQLAGKAAAAIHARVKSLSTTRRFPSPRQLLALPEERLRKAGLSRSKLLALKDLAARTQDGTVPALSEMRQMNDEEIIQRLTVIRGIGRWTVEMLLIFRLGRPDVLPITDYGIRKGFALAFGTGDLPAPSQLAKHGERWRPYRTVAAWYLWRALEIPAGAE